VFVKWESEIKIEQKKDKRKKQGERVYREKVKKKSIVSSSGHNNL